MSKTNVEPAGKIRAVTAGADSWVLELGIAGWLVAVRPISGDRAPYRMDFEPRRPQAAAGGSYSGAASMALALEAAASGIESITHKAVDRGWLMEIAEDFDQ